MLDSFSEIFTRFSGKSKSHANLESYVFHCNKLAMGATLLACILVTATAYFGDNISCLTGFSGQSHHAIETYCFISSTFSMINFTEAEQPYVGVGPLKGLPDESLERHAYYQWVPLVLALQTFALYSPKWVWKEVLDRKKFATVLEELHKYMIDEEDKVRRIRLSARYMASAINTNTPYALKFLLCEVIAFFVALANLFFTNAFVGGAFFDYGRGALSYVLGDVEDMDNPLNNVFPKVSKCMWRKFGASGTIETYDALCVLPRNIVNEKTYILLWLVYVVTFAVLCVVLTYHFALLLAGNSMRCQIIAHKLQSPSVQEAFAKLTPKLDYGDWFFVKKLGHRMFGNNFEIWLQELADQVLK